MYSPGTQYNLFELLQKADNGDLEAMETAVMLMAAEGYTNEDPDGEIAEREISYLHQLANAGKSVAYIMLGSAYEKGNGVIQDPQEAIRWYEKAVESGIRFGNESIGMMYYEGTAIAKDYEKAFTYFTKDEGKKSFCTLYALGEMYRRGLYVKKDEGKACDYYASIVYSEEPYPEIDAYYWQACYRLSRAMHYGQGWEKDMDTAVELLQIAKEHFDSRNDYSLETDITKEELYREWVLLNQDAGKY